MITNEMIKYLFIQPSEIEGYGLFTRKEIKKKSILAIPDKGLFTNNFDSIKEKQTAIRYCLEFFQYGSELTLEDYLNHSDNPNCIYHCGILFALKNIHSNEELTIDYSLLLPENNNIDYVKKISKEESFKTELKILLNLFSED